MAEQDIGFLFTSQRHVDVTCIKHLHPYAEIVIVTEGTLEMVIGNQKYSIKTGQGVYVSPFEMHSFDSPAHNKCHVILFSKELSGYFHDFLLDKEITGHIFSLSQESTMLSERTLPDMNNTVDYFTAQATLSLLCLDIIHGCEFRKKERCPDDIIERTLQYINENFSNELSLESVARHVGVRPVTLSKTFSKKLGENFSTYVHFLRCNSAANMMKKTDLTLSDIACRCGFGSIRSYNRVFRALYGMTPSEYRQANRFI